MDDRRTLEDFGLIRQLAPETNFPKTMLCIISRPVIGTTLRMDWERECVRDVNETCTLLTYGISLSKGCLVVTEALLRNTYGLIGRHDQPSDRLTDMRLWQMIIQCWQEAGGRPENLRYVGFFHIVNEDVRLAINREMDRSELRSGETAVITPTDAGWDANLFARCASSVARGIKELVPELPDPQLTAHLLSETYRKKSIYHMIVELKETR